MLAFMKRLNWARVLLGIGLFAYGTGCIGENEEVVFVEPRIEQAQVSVSQGTLGTGLTGSFQLHLILGPRASGPSTVNLDLFDLKTADKTKALVSPLEAAGDKSFPLTVEVDSEQTLQFTIDFGAMLLPANTFTDICGAGGVRISGSIRDSLSSGPTLCASDIVMPSGCTL